MSGEEQSVDAYAAALDRLLDGLEPAADGAEAAAAGAQASADLDSITRALGLIGDALAGEGSGAGAVPPATEAGGVVVAMSSWRRKLNPRVLAAAAVGLLVIGLGVPVALSTGGSDSDESATALDAARSQGDAAGTAPAAAVPEAATAADRALGTTGGYDAAAGAAAAPGAASAAGTLDATANDDQSAAEALAAAPQDPAAPTAGVEADVPAAKTSTKKDSAATAFADAVACARGILVGQITAVQPGSSAGRVKVTLLVTDWIVPSSGPALITYEVGNPNALTPDGEEKLTAGQRRLFVVPAQPSAQAYAYPDSPESRDRIAAVRAERSGEDCK